MLSLRRRLGGATMSAVFPPGQEGEGHLMNILVQRDPLEVRPPDHTELPDTDGDFVKNFQEHPQSTLLTDSLLPVLQRRHPDGHYAIGQDCGIYWHWEETGARRFIAPDWFYVGDVTPTYRGQVRRSYVRWYEPISPLLVLEFASGDGAEERDRTPWEGKFWVYERVIRPGFYGIYEVRQARVEMYHLIEGELLPMRPNERGHYPLAALGVELGIWQGAYLNYDLPWLRCWDAQGRLLPTGHELAQEERARADRLAARLRGLGVDPDAL
jgi:Uma2 family endonuclease